MLKVGSVLTQLRLDFAVSFVFEDESCLRIETPFELERGTDVSRVLPDSVGDAAAALVLLLGGQVEAVEMTNDGRLWFRFLTGDTIRIAADDAYEAWSLVEADGSQWICLPGGGLSSF
jgi:Family of unknown function (DUF6188)